jgi:hypothetical protein
MDAESFFETSVSLYHSTQRQTIEESNIYCSLITIISTMYQLVPDLSSDPPRHKEYRGGWGRQGSYAKSKLQKTASFIEVKPLNIYQSRHTHTHTNVLLVALIFPK